MNTPIENIVAAIGNRLRHHRQNRNETQLEVALNADLHQPYIHDGESGKLGNLTLLTFFRWCRALGVLPSQILKEAGL